MKALILMESYTGWELGEEYLYSPELIIMYSFKVC